MSSNYTNPGNWCKPLSGIKYISTEELIWDVGYKGSGLTVTVPTGTVFDVSIPQPPKRPRVFLLWPFWLVAFLLLKLVNKVFSPHNPKFLKAAALHDTMLIQGWARTTSGAEFHEALKADNVQMWKRLIMWLAVSLFKYR